MSNNPFSDNQQSPYAFQSQVPIGGDDSYVKQLPVVGILSIVQASLELLVAAMLAFAAVMAGVVQNNPRLTNQPNLPPMFWIIVGYGIIGSAVGVVALLRLASGIMILRRRGRMFSIVVSILGLATVFTCYCSLTSVGLCVYSLVVLIQPSVIEEYENAKAT
jgi:hypothetical protein